MSPLADRDVVPIEQDLAPVGTVIAAIGQLPQDERIATGHQGRTLASHVPAHSLSFP